MWRPPAASSGLRRRSGGPCTRSSSSGGWTPRPSSSRRRSVPELVSYDYAVVRVVPSVEREEFLNAGAVVFCAQRDWLEAKVELDEARLRAFAPSADLEDIRQHLLAIPRICAGGPEAGPIGALSRKERWHWLVAPRSTVI